MTEDPDRLLHIFRKTIVSEVRFDQADLSLRQFAVFLNVYRNYEAQTVRSLAKDLKISKSTVTRGLDRLSEHDLVRRKVDVTDRRSVLVMRTNAGTAMMRRLADAMMAARESP